MAIITSVSMDNMDINIEINKDILNINMAINMDKLSNTSYPFL